MKLFQSGCFHLIFPPAAQEIHNSSLASPVIVSLSVHSRHGEQSYLHMVLLYVTK